MTKLHERQVNTGVGTMETDLFPTKLSAVNPELAQIIVTHGDDNDALIGKLIDDSFSCPASQLRPSQSQLNVESALLMALSMLYVDMFGGALGSIISGDNYIMDGHHRWAATLLIKPNAIVSGIRIDVPGEALIGLLNTITVGLFHRTGNANTDDHIKNFSGQAISGLLHSYLSTGVRLPLSKLVHYGEDKQLTAIDVRDLLLKLTKGNVQACISFIATNADTLAKEIPSWAPSRVDMPVIRRAELAKLVASLQSGSIDVFEPYSKETKEVFNSWKHLSGVKPSS